MTEPCLPIAPSVRRAEVVIVTYCCGEATEREPAHTHTAIYDLDGNALANECSLGLSRPLRRVES